MSRVGLIFALTVAALGGCLYVGEKVIGTVVRDFLAERAIANAQHWIDMIDDHLLVVFEDHAGHEGFVDHQHARAMDAIHNDVFRYKLFRKNGQMLFDSGATDERGLTEGTIHKHSVTPDSDSAQLVISTSEPIAYFKSGNVSEQEPFFFSETYAPIYKNGQIIGAAEVYVDMTEIYSHMQQTFRSVALTYALMVSAALLIPTGFVLLIWWRLKQTNRHLSIARDRAVAAEKSRAEFLANMSHEIRTPMNGIVGMAEMLDASLQSGEHKAFTSTIVRSSLALVEIINDILDFSKIDAGKMTVSEEPFNLYSLVHDVGALLAPLAEHKSVECIVDFQLQANCTILGDAGRLRQCLLNIVGNAVKFTDSGYVLVTVKQNDEEMLEISVQDTGIGISDADIRSIFSPFEQVDTHATRKHQGTGLGLAITDNLVKLMGGKLSATSLAGTGSTFTIQLPLQCIPADQNQTNSQPIFGSGRALVIEDIAVNQSLIATMLRPLNLSCDPAHTASEGLAMIGSAQQGPSPYTVVLIDYSLPDMKPLELIATLRDIPGCANLPCVLMSCSVPSLQTNAIPEITNFATLPKPIRIDSLRSALSLALNGMPIPQEDDNQADQETDVFLGNIKILTAEDNRTNQMVVEKMLNATGVDLTICNNGAEIVQAFSSQPRPDLILMDVSMPVLNGLDATKLIRAAEIQNNWPYTPIIALTANATKEDSEACRTAGMDDFITKPLRRKVLIETIAKWTAQDDEKNAPQLLWGAK